jgi:hypothetical protein
VLDECCAAVEQADQETARSTFEERVAVGDGQRKSEIAKDRRERHARRPADDGAQEGKRERIAERSAHPLVGLVRS